MPAPARSKPPQEFSLVSFVRAHCRDAELLPGEGQFELSAVAAAGEQFAKSSGALIRGHVLPLNRAEAGGLTTGTLAGGGAMVASGGITLAEALAPVLMIERLGARRVQARAGDLIVSPPAVISGSWVGEDGDANGQTALFAAALRDPREAACRVKLSRRMLRQAGMIAEQEMRALLQRSLAATIEAGILNGSGTNSEPMGIVNDLLLQRRTFTGGALPTRARVGELVSELLDAGADLEAVQILASSADFDTSQAGTPLVEIAPDGRRRLATIPVVFSPFVPTGNLIIADWSRVAVAYVGPPQLITDPYTESDSGAMLLTLFQSVSYAVERRELLTVATLEA